MGKENARGWRPQEPVPDRLPLTVEKIRSVRAVRDARETELVELLAQPGNARSAWTDAWFQLKLAQGEFDHLVETEIRTRLDRQSTQ